MHLKIIKDFKFIENALKDFPFDSQDGLLEEAICSAVFCLGENIRWYILEGQRKGNDIIMFGIVIMYGHTPSNSGVMTTIEEYLELECGCDFGFVSLSVLLKNEWANMIENFQPTPLKEIEDARLHQFMRRMKTFPPNILEASIWATELTKKP